MKNPLERDLTQLPLPLAQQIDDACDCFEEGWRQGQRPRIQDVLSAVPEVARAVLLYELVGIEIRHRRRLGDLPPADEYLGLFPALDPHWLRRVLEVARTPVANSRKTPVPWRASPERSTVAGYQILGVLGRGGMGVVYKARQTHLKRVVALKTILGETAAARHTLALRFQKEAEAQAGLQHSHIVQVYDAGEADGRPYLAMEYVAGGTLAKKLGHLPQAPAAAAQLIETLARAMQYAHQHGLIHRDLKPSNILLATDGTPKIADFGLVKSLQDSASATRSGDVLGTPCYMAPEQIAGPEQPIGPQADVHALGAILYEMLTGRPPFLGGTIQETLWQVQHLDPLPPRSLQPLVSENLQTICLKCLHKEPGRRYATAEALAEDLRRFQAGEPITARPPGLVERGWYWCRRQPAIAGLAGSLFLVVVGSLIGLTLLWLRAEHQRELAERHGREVESERNRAEQSLHQLSRNADLIGRMSSQHGLGPSGTGRDLEDVLKGFTGVLDLWLQDPRRQQEVAMTLFQVGFIQKQIRSEAVALETLKKARDRLEKVANDTTPDLQRALAVCYTHVGHLEYQAKRLDQAGHAYQQACATWELLARLHPEEPGILSKVAQSHFHLGNWYSGTGRPQEAVAAYVRCSAIHDKLVRLLPTVSNHQDQLACYRAMAHLEHQLGRDDKALNALQKASECFETLLANHPGSWETRQALADTYSDLGNLYRQTRDFRKAAAVYRRSCVLQAKLSADHPELPVVKSNLAGSYVNLANMLRILGKLDEATTFLQLACRQREELQKANPDLATYTATLAGNYLFLGDVHSTNNQPGEALDAYRRAHRLWENLARDNQLNPKYLSRLGDTQGRMGENQWQRMGALPEAAAILQQAIGHQRQALELAPKIGSCRQLLSDHYRNLAGVFLEMDQPVKAAAIIQERRMLWPRNGAELVKTACQMMDCFRQVRGDQTGFTPEQKRERLRYADEAMNILREAVQAGYRDIGYLKREMKLEPLRPRADFQELLAQLGEKKR